MMGKLGSQLCKIAYLPGKISDNSDNQFTLGKISHLAGNREMAPVRYTVL